MSVRKAVALLVAVAFATGQTASLCPTRQKAGYICPRSIDIEIKFKPYYEEYFDKAGSTKSLYPQILTNASSQCCSSSVVRFVPVNSTRDIEELLTDESCHKEEHNDTRLTFYFPVFVKEGEKVVFDDEFQFIKLAKSPGPAIMMLKSEKGKMRVTASVAVRESWPLFVLIISLSSTVGLLGWLLDHSSNPSQFSSWFYKGSWEGFWWAMVTITTVGYGDKVPVAFSARLLTILWMFCGAIILSLFTANVTSVLTSNQVDDTRNLIGHKIAVLNSKHYFESTLNVGSSIEEFDSQEKMFAGLRQGTVDRILTPSANQYLNSPLDGKNGNENDLLSIVDVIPEPFLTGLALANKDTTINDRTFITCLKRKVKTLKDHVHSSTNQLPPKETDAPLRTTMLFQEDIVKIIYYNLIAIGVIAGVGIFLDIIRCVKPKSKRKSSYAEEVEMTGLEANV